MQTVTLPSPDPEDPNTVVFGEVLGMHIDESVITEGLVDFGKLQAIGRLGYNDYVHVSQAFTMIRPKWPPD